MHHLYAVCLLLDASLCVCVCDWLSLKSSTDSIGCDPVCVCVCTCVTSGHKISSIDSNGCNPLSVCAHLCVSVSVKFKICSIASNGCEKREIIYIPIATLSPPE